MRRPLHINSLPENILLDIWSKLPPGQQRRAMASVCKRWQAICGSEQAAPLWSTVQVALPAGLERTFSLSRMFAWFLRKAPFIQQLEVDIGSRQAWVPVHALLGLLGMRLTHLRICDSEGGVFEPASRCPWLFLCPKLLSLELENAVDCSVDQAAFPAGLTHLQLSNCGEEGLYRLPDQLTALHCLRSLELQGSMFDNELTVEQLAQCTSIERLDLSDCCLDAVPSALVALTRLTRLTLNSNTGLGEKGSRQPEILSVLSSLHSLQCLEFRDCALTCAPASIAQLTNLRTVLLGYNEMSARPCLPPGPWLEGLRMLAMSDASDFQDPTPVEVLSLPLQPATRLEVLRLNRNPGLRLGVPEMAALVAGKPRMRKVEVSEEMLGGDAGLRTLSAAHPGLTFRVVD